MCSSTANFNPTNQVYTLANMVWHRQLFFLPWNQWVEIQMPAIPQFQLRILRSLTGSETNNLPLNVHTIAHLRGTKQGCGIGSCGACTVVLSYFNKWQSKIVYVAINACILPICSLHGMAVTTIEGIGSTETKLHPCQVSGERHIPA